MSRFRPQKEVSRGEEIDRLESAIQKLEIATDRLASIARDPLRPAKRRVPPKPKPTFT